MIKEKIKKIKVYIFKFRPSVFSKLRFLTWIAVISAIFFKKVKTKSKLKILDKEEDFVYSTDLLGHVKKENSGDIFLSKSQDILPHCDRRQVPLEPTHYKRDRLV